MPASVGPTIVFEMYTNEIIVKMKHKFITTTINITLTGTDIARKK